MTTINLTDRLRMYDRLDAHLAARYAHRQASRGSRTDAFHPSIHCDRMNVLARAGKDHDPLEGGTFWNFRRGEDVESDILGALKAGADAGEYQAQFQGSVRSSDGHISGTFDFLLTYPDGKVILGDVKSCQGSSIDWKRRKPDESYRRQVGRYAYLLPPVASTGLILYAAKEKRLLLEDWFDLAPYIEQAREWHVRIAGAWSAWLADGTLPGELVPEDAREKVRGYSWRCGYCTFTRYCPAVLKEMNRNIFEVPHDDGGKP